MFFGLYFWNMGCGYVNRRSDVSAEQRQLDKILDEAAIKLMFQNYSTYKDLSISNESDGMMGNTYYASIIDHDSNAICKVVIKEAPSEMHHRAASLIVPSYQNEIYFYSHIHPKLIASLEKRDQILDFYYSDLGLSMPTPEYVTSQSILGKEMVVLKDLNAEGYEIHDQSQPLDEGHIRSVFKAYGRFHAISFCLKDENPEEFEELLKPLTNIWETNLNNEEYVQRFTILIEQSIDEALDEPKYFHLRNRLESYLTSFPQVLLETLKYNEEYGCLLHGDGWTNNIMFKYKDSKKTLVKAVKLLDFQASKYGSPVQDLSLFLYVAAANSKKILDKLEHLLDDYYTSFHQTATQLNKDSEKLLPREILSEDWITYSKSSMLLAILFLKVKFVNINEAIKHRQSFKTNSSNNNNSKRLVNVVYDKALFKQNFLNILEHMYEIGAL